MRFPSMAMAPCSMTSLFSFMVTINALRSRVFIVYLTKKLKARIAVPLVAKSVCGLHKSHLAAPVFRILEKIDNLLTRFLAEIAFAQAGIQNVVPIREHVQFDVVFCQVQLSFVLVQTIRSIIEDTQAVRHSGTRTADADIKTQLAETVRNQIFHQHYPLARLQNAFDLFGAAVTFGLLTNIDHRFLKQMRHE